MPLITKLGDNGIIWIITALIFISIKKYRLDGITIVISLLFSFLIGNLCLKPLIARPRPCDINTAVLLLIPRPSDYSFPSAHTMSSFAAATVIYYKNKYNGTSFAPECVAAAILAVLIAFSRLYLYVHYPSDVLCGAILGIAVGLFTLCVRKKALKRLKIS